MICLLSIKSWGQYKRIFFKFEVIFVKGERKVTFIEYLVLGSILEVLQNISTRNFIRFRGSIIIFILRLRYLWLGEVKGIIQFSEGGRGRVCLDYTRWDFRYIVYGFVGLDTVAYILYYWVGVGKVGDDVVQARKRIISCVVGGLVIDGGRERYVSFILRFVFSQSYWFLVRWVYSIFSCFFFFFEVDLQGCQRKFLVLGDTKIFRILKYCMVNFGIVWYFIEIWIKYVWCI